MRARSRGATFTNGPGTQDDDDEPDTATAWIGMVASDEVLLDDDRTLDATPVRSCAATARRRGDTAWPVQDMLNRFREGPVGIGATAPARALRRGSRRKNAGLAGVAMIVATAKLKVMADRARMLTLVATPESSDSLSELDSPGSVGTLNSLHGSVVGSLRQTDTARPGSVMYGEAPQFSRRDAAPVSD